MARQRDDIDQLYKSSRWLKVRKLVMQRDYGLCQRCRRRGIITRGDTVHHIIEARADLSRFYALDNLECICRACHNKEHGDRSQPNYLGKKQPITDVYTFYSNREL